MPLPLPGEGRALTLCLSTCPLALILVQTQRAHILSFRLFCGEGRAARTGVCVGNGLRRWVRGKQDTQMTPPCMGPRELEA